jgi:hypothetical protein
LRSEFSQDHYSFIQFRNRDIDTPFRLAIAYTEVTGIDGLPSFHYRDTLNVVPLHPWSPEEIPGDTFSGFLDIDTAVQAFATDVPTGDIQAGDIYVISKEIDPNSAWAAFSPGTLMANREDGSWVATEMAHDDDGMLMYNIVDGTVYLWNEISPNEYNWIKLGFPVL